MLGSVASVSFLAFVLLYLISGEFYFLPLLGAVYFFYLEAKSRHKNKRNRFFDLQSQRFIEFPKPPLLHPLSYAKWVIALHEGAISIHDRGSHSGLCQEISSLQALPPLCVPDGFYAATSDRIILYGFSLEEKASFPYQGGQIILWELDADQVLYAGTSSQELHCVKGSDYQKLNLPGLPISLSHDRLYTSCGRVLNLPDLHGIVQIKEPVLTSFDLDSGIYGFFAEEWIYLVRDQVVEKKGPFQKEPFFPFVFDSKLFFCDRQKQLLALSGSDQKVIAVLPSLPVLHLVSRDFFVLACDLKDGVRLYFYNHSLFEFQAGKDFKPLGMAADCFYFLHENQTFVYQNQTVSLYHQKALQEMLCFDGRLYYKKDQIWCDDQGRFWSDLKPAQPEHLHLIQSSGLIPCVS